MRVTPGIAIVVFSLFTSCLALRSLLGATEPHPPRPPAPDAALPEYVEDAGIVVPPMWVEGPLLRATLVAVGDLAKRNEHHLDDPTWGEFYRCLSRLDAYDAQVVRQEVDRWVIYVGPRLQRCYDPTDAGDRHLLGGAVTYEVSKADFRILSAEFWE